MDKKTEKLFSKLFETLDLAVTLLSELEERIADSEEKETK